MCFMAQSNQFIREIVERVNQWIHTYAVPRQGALLFWHCALFAQATCPFEILAGALTWAFRFKILIKIIHYTKLKKTDVATLFLKH